MCLGKMLVGYKIASPTCAGGLKCGLPWESVWISFFRVSIITGLWQECSDSFFHSLIYSRIAECLPFGRHYSRCWGYSKNEQNIKCFYFSEVRSTCIVYCVRRWSCYRALKHQARGGKAAERGVLSWTGCLGKESLLWWLVNTEVKEQL